MPLLNDVIVLEQTLTKAQKDIKDVRELVKLGTITLGSDIADFAFIWHPDDRAKWHDFYTALDQICTKDQPLVIKYEKTTSRLIRTVYGGAHTYASDLYHSQQLTVLESSLQFNVQKGEVLLPSQFHYVQSSRTFEHHDWKRQESSIVISHHSFKNYGKYIYHSYVEGDSSAMPHDSSLNIIFGNKEEYLKRHGSVAENYNSIFAQKRLVGPMDQTTKQLTLTISPER